MAVEAFLYWGMDIRPTSFVDFVSSWTNQKKRKAKEGSIELLANLAHEGSSQFSFTLEKYKRYDCTYTLRVVKLLIQSTYVFT